MTDKKIILDNSFEQLIEIATAYNQKAFRATQLHQGLQNGNSISQIKTLPKDFIASLLLDYNDCSIEIIEERHSKIDQTIKYLFKLHDNNIIEGVLMKYEHGYTQCVSTQVGCRMGCKFCASTLNGLVRNLTAGEILAQVLAVNRAIGGDRQKRMITNIVLMGSGEPLDNYQNVIKFLRLISSPNSLNISPRNISLSTCGIVDNIYKLAEEGLPINLTISLHNPVDEERKKIMPIANAYTIAEILKACRFYFEKTGRRYIFEYCLIHGKTDSLEHIKQLHNILKGHPCHVNLIRLNEVKENPLQSVSQKQAQAFANQLIAMGISATVRRQIGVDIDGACGQLRASYLEGEKTK